MPSRLTFLSHFVICLAICAGMFFAWEDGIVQLVIANDVARWFGGVISLLFITGAVQIGQHAWIADSYSRGYPRCASSDFGHLVIWLSPAIGMLGTVVGLSLVFKNISDASALSGGAVAFYSTGCGLVSMILTMLIVYNLEVGIKRGDGK